MSQIKKLTKAQEALLPQYREKWLNYGLSTIRADKEKAVEGIRLAYKHAGMEPPKYIIWLDSPHQGAIGAALLASQKSVGAQVGAQVGDQVGAQVWAQVWDQVGAQVWDQVWRCGYGLHDANWVGFYDFFNSEFGLAEKIEGLRLITQNCGWWWPFENFCILTERPVHLSRDDRGRLHCEDRAAIEYPDGWGVYAWHGVRVPEYVIRRPQEITVGNIEEESNAEIRRVMIERYGLDRYMEDSGATVIHQDEKGTLLRKEIPDDEPIVTVKVINSTPEPDGTFKNYFLRVNPECRPLLADNKMGEAQELTATNAIASTFGMTGEEYKLQMET